MTELYNPCRNGLHVCAISEADPSEPMFVTFANVEGVSEAMFDQLEKAFAQSEDEVPDLVVDFMVDGDIIRDFSIRQQQAVALLGTAKCSVEDAREHHAEGVSPTRCDPPQAAPRPEGDEPVRTET